MYADDFLFCLRMLYLILVRSSRPSAARYMWGVWAEGYQRQLPSLWQTFKIKMLVSSYPSASLLVALPFALSAMISSSPPRPFHPIRISHIAALNCYPAGGSASSIADPISCVSSPAFFRLTQYSRLWYIPHSWLPNEMKREYWKKRKLVTLWRKANLRNWDIITCIISSIPCEPQMSSWNGAIQMDLSGFLFSAHMD